MDIAELTAQAMALRDRFAAANQVRGVQPWTREDIMQGFVVDVGDLMRLVMAHNGRRAVDDASGKLAHELADCLWSVLVLARLYGVDLEAEFGRMVTEASAQLAGNTSASRPSSETP